MTRSQLLRKSLLNGALCVGVIVLFEGLLHILSLSMPVIDRVTVAPWASVAEIVDDDELEFRGNPHFPGHDEWGFRNEHIPTNTSIVALGDSHTYGVSVRSEQSWPQVLSNMTSRVTYNMGMSGYGPRHSQGNLSLGLSLRPDLVVFAFYFGNDLFESFSFVLRQNALEEFVSPLQFKEAVDLDRQDPLEEDIINLFTMGETKSEVTGVRQWLSYNSKVYGLLRTAKNIVIGSSQAPEILSKDFHQAVKSLKPRQLEYSSIFEGKNWKTIFTAPYRMQALDQSDLRIRLGGKISKAVIKDMNDVLRALGVHFLVVLLPTKESVFWERVEQPNEHQDLEALIFNEKKFRNELIGFMTSRKIRYLDLLPDLRNAKVQPYFEDADGHPNEAGHQIIADRITQYLHVHSL